MNPFTSPPSSRARSVYSARSGLRWLLGIAAAADASPGGRAGCDNPPRKAGGPTAALGLLVWLLEWWDPSSSILSHVAKE